MVEDVRLGRDDPLDRAVLAQEIGHQHLDRRIRGGGADRRDGPREMAGAAIVEIVAVDRGHNDVLEAERGDRLPDPRWLVRIEQIGPAGCDIAEGAGAGAHSAEEHYGRVLFLPPLDDIVAARPPATPIDLEVAPPPPVPLVFPPCPPPPPTPQRRLPVSRRNTLYTWPPGRARRIDLPLPMDGKSPVSAA